MNKQTPRFKIESSYGNFYIITEHPRTVVAMCSKEVDVTLLCDRANAYHANQQEIADLKATVERLRGFIERVSKQKPEKPDYWCSCGQCDRNIADADDLMDLFKTEASHE
jgi:hypothetical protein